MSRVEQAETAAAYWIIAEADGPLGDSERAEFEAWLAASASHKAAYWRLRRGWREADRMAALGSGNGTKQTTTPSRARWRRWVPISVAASLALVVGAQLLLHAPADRGAQVAIQTYSTNVGVQKSVKLADGSRVQINTASDVRAAVSPAAREIWVDRGEAFFEVKHKNGQPFIVHAGDRRITVLGTKFSVRHDGEEVKVVVLEGRVRVDQLENNQAVRSQIIVGGDIALAKGASTIVTTRSEERVESALSWRGGMLTFDRETLGDIAAEFNRYNEKKIAIVDTQASAVRIAGVFPANDPDGFVELLRDAYGLKVEEAKGEIRISN